MPHPPQTKRQLKRRLVQRIQKQVLHPMMMQQKRTKRTKKNHQLQAEGILHTFVNLHHPDVERSGVIDAGSLFFRHLYLVRDVQ